MINHSISHYVQQHEMILKELISSANIPADRIRQAILYMLFPGGKRLRPVLVYLTGELVGIERPCLDIIAAAIELTHCYSLIHDDLPSMDNDDFRRGKPSCHKAFDEATAILAGDGLQAFAIELLVQHLPEFLTPAKTLTIISELVHASGPSGMVSGQSLDLSELAKPEVSEAQLGLIHVLKTGKLILACINMVLSASEVAPSVREALTSYAKHLGLVFQMQDDYLDSYATADLLGKGRSSDSINQKLTFASLYSKDELNALINSYYNQAKEALNPLGSKASNLLALTSYLHLRGAKEIPYSQNSQVEV